MFLKVFLVSFVVQGTSPLIQIEQKMTEEQCVQAIQSSDQKCMDSRQLEAWLDFMVFTGNRSIEQ